GSIKSFLPVIVAFVLFGVFASLCFWFILRSNSRSHSTSSPELNELPIRSPVSPFQSAPSKRYAQLAPGFPSGGAKNSSSSSFSGAASPVPSGALDAATAREVVEPWLQYKSILFAPPYDKSNLDAFVASPGPLHSDIVKPGGTVEWLKSHQSSYKYNDIKVLAVSDFRQFGRRASLVLQILEDLELHTPQGVDKARSGRNSQTWVYDLEFQHGKWLIYDFKNDI
ncbi:ARC6/PARC6 family protein, partial [Cyanobium sp. N5-Cardenillas]|uniref:ARC6/PARC6 family protein n=1 Tax=Cyanobium sp. N5-Cardenillas TaxID=2823720 RepID=UPI0020CD4F96